jgi:hypothetical protein
LPSTSTWISEEIVEDSYEIEVQRDAPAGSYDLEIGVYDPTTSERLRVADAAGAEIGDRAILQRVEVR